MPQPGTLYSCSDRNNSYKPASQLPEHNLPDSMPVGKSATWLELILQSRFRIGEAFADQSLTDKAEFQAWA